MDKSFYVSLKKEVRESILPYWETYAKDTTTSGFYGEIDNSNNGNPKTDRSVVMTARFLWTYSAAARLFSDESYFDMAEYASVAMQHEYYDRSFGGYYWSVKPDGSPAVSKKQIYGEAFSLYALCEYAAALKEVKKMDYPSTVVMDKALAVFSLLERYAKDHNAGGYIEACSEDWKDTKDLKLSEKDIDCAKSMNTNLHVLEAYTNLYRTLAVVYPDQKDLQNLVGKALAELVTIMADKIRMKDNHLGLYFNMDWSRIDQEISFGHDIEASWLIWEAANELGDEKILEQMRPVSLGMARIALSEGFDKKAGALEDRIVDGKRDRTRIWWNQAESLNGFYNAWELSGKEDFKNAFLKQWDWILNFQKDKKNGDWFSAVDENGKPILSEPKGGNWKTSYHNARCCMELLRRSGTAGTSA